MIRQRLFLFRLAWINTFKKKFRAGLAIGGIALSSAIMVLLMGVGLGLQALVTQEVGSSDSVDIVTVNQRNMQQIKLNEARISEISSFGGVGEVGRLVGVVSEVTYHGINLNMPTYAVTNDFFGMVPGMEGPEGEPLQLAGLDELVVSQRTLEIFGISENEAIGKEVTVAVEVPSDYASSLEGTTKVLRAETFTIAAVIDRGSLPVAYLPLEYLVRNGVDSVSQLKVRLTDPGNMLAVRESIEQLGLQTTSIQDSIDQVNRIFAVIQKIILVFAFIALVITVFSTFNVITLTLIEETKQIGFLRIMGMKSRAVGFLFVAQSIMLTSFGAVAGVTIGVLLGLLANGALQTTVRDLAFSGSVYIFKIPMLSIILMLMLSLLLGWLIGILPARRAVKINPLQELQG